MTSWKLIYFEYSCSINWSSGCVHKVLKLFTHISMSIFPWLWTQIRKHNFYKNIFDVVLCYCANWHFYFFKKMVFLKVFLIFQSAFLWIIFLTIDFFYRYFLIPKIKKEILERIPKFSWMVLAVSSCLLIIFFWFLE